MKKIKPFLWIGLGFLLLLVSVERHKNKDVFNYHSRIWADAAGYYSYLPATFIYTFHAHDFPVNSDSLTGGGFSLKTFPDKVFTKYTYGVALLEAPFFLINHLCLKLESKPSNGFNNEYGEAINLAAIFYGVLGLYLLWCVLKLNFSEGTSWIVILSILLGTNLFYYIIVLPGMAHVYSFFLICLYIFSLSCFNQKQDFKWVFLLSLSYSLLILIRPLNALFGVLLFIIPLNAALLKHLFTWKNFLFFICIFCLICIPQMVYWHFISGKWIFYSYEHESFSNWKSPFIKEVLFSTRNGLFTFNPLHFFSLAGIVVLLRTNKFRALSAVFLFAMTIYATSSWWVWWFGCSFGSRNFVEGSAFLAIPLAICVQEISRGSKIKKVFCYLLIIGCCIYNLKLAKNFDSCWYGDVWDWKELWRLLSS